jgi:hypothetical protein
VVWSLLLTAGSEGPSLISCTASHLLSSVRSWHTVVGISAETVTPSLQLLVEIVEHEIA